MRRKMIQQDHRISVFSYNVLADINAHQEAFPDTNASCLAWETRKAHILREMLQASPTIMCLQEVDKAMFAWFSERLLQFNYRGVHKMKPSGREGLATFYHYDIVEMTPFVILDDEPVWTIEGVDETYTITEFVVRDRPGLPHAQGSFLVANVHLKAEPENAEIRMNQIVMLLSKLRIVWNKHPSLLGTFIAGDFNDVPKSDVIAKVQDHNFVSSYGNIQEGRADPAKFTTWKHRESHVIRMIDWIFFKGKFILDEILELPTIAQVGSHMPNASHPSDHLPLYASFILCDKKQ